MASSPSIYKEMLETSINSFLTWPLNFMRTSIFLALGTVGSVNIKKDEVNWPSDCTVGGGADMMVPCCSVFKDTSFLPWVLLRGITTPGRTIYLLVCCGALIWLGTKCNVFFFLSEKCTFANLISDGYTLVDFRFSCSGNVNTRLC